MGRGGREHRGLSQLSAPGGGDGRQGLRGGAPVRRSGGVVHGTHPRGVRVPGPEVLGGVARLHSAIGVVADAGPVPRRGRRPLLRRRHRSGELRRCADRPARLRQERRGDRAGARRRRSADRRGRQVRRQCGVLRPADGPHGGRSTRRGAREGVLRSDSVDPRLRRLRPAGVRRRAHRGGHDSGVRVDRRRGGHGPRGDRTSLGGIAVRGGELLRQRQTDRRGSGSATVRRGAGVGYQRQGGLAAQPAAVGIAAHDQGDLRPAHRSSLPAHGVGARPRTPGVLSNPLRPARADR